MAIATGTALVGSAIIGAAASRQAAKKKAEAERAAAEQSAAIQREALQEQRQMYGEQKEVQDPWRRAGEQALNKLIPLASQYTPFGMQQFQADPGYAFRLAEGQKALERQAAARGGLISGSALKAAQRFGQQMASEEYMNAFNRYQSERSARLNPLQSLAGIGQTSANALTGAAGQMSGYLGQFGANLGENYLRAGLQRGATIGAGYMGAANALSGAASEYVQYKQGQEKLAMERERNRVLGQLANSGRGPMASLY